MARSIISDNASYKFEKLRSGLIFKMLNWVALWQTKEEVLQIASLTCAACVYKHKMRCINCIAHFSQFNCRRISVIVLRSASDTLAVDSLLWLVCRPSRKRKSVWQINSNQRFVNDNSCLANSPRVHTCTVIHTL